MTPVLRLTTHIMHNKVLITLIVMFIMSGCSSNHSISKKLLYNIETEINNTHKIEHGKTIAQYDLTNHKNTQCIHTPHYALVINDATHNRKFIKKIVPRCSQTNLLEQNAQNKLHNLTNHLITIHKKYDILSRSEHRAISDLTKKKPILNSVFDALHEKQGKNHTTNSNYLVKLHKIDHLSKHVPIFFPQYNAKLTSSFGMRKHPCSKVYKFHYGTDFVGAKSTAIYSAADGNVLAVERREGYGNIISIDHGKGFVTRYAHLSKILVKQGNHVIKGQKIALQGATGKVSGEHLHFEIMLKGKHVNPMDFIATGYECQKH